MDAERSGIAGASRLSRACGTFRLAAALLCVPVVSACQVERRVEPTMAGNPAINGLIIAIAPALNQSGSADFDPSRFADLMASELDQVDGISIIPVSRVLAALGADGRDRIESSEYALELTRTLGADAILVFAVTEYASYAPPSIGITAQLYGQRPGAGGRSLDPVAYSRQVALAAAPPRRTPSGLLARTQRVFNASHDAVVKEIKHFASRRRGDHSPYGWRKFVVSQQHFIRYCCHATIREIVRGYDESTLATGDPREVGMP